MKKITLLFALVLMTSIGFSQTVIIDRPDNGVNSIIATLGNDGTAVYCADQFVLATDVTLGTLEVFGFNSNNGNLGALLLGMNIYIYDDVAGLPGGDPGVGGGVVELSNIAAANFTHTEDGAGDSNFLLNITDANGGTQITLPAGLYWMVAFPSVDSPPAGAGRWNWALSDATPAVEPVLIDPADLFGLGATAWTNIAGLIGATATGMAWVLVDEPLLGVNDNIAELASVFPNPANDVLNVSIPSNVEVRDAQLFDILGKDTGVRLVDGQMNTSTIARGVYMLNVRTSAGTLTQKIIKQ